ncbi:MAG: protein kinase [Candidatus Sulfomarinibacteraceae bacterium]
MTTRELETGMALGRYRLEARIGEGGMGSVWKARDELLERDVALKALPRALVTDPSAERRFEREARAMGRLQHPNVVGIYDIGTADPGSGDEIPFLVMELVPGRPLNELIFTRPDFREILRWMEQVTRALSAAHAAGIVHRDLKPSNIMVDDEGHVVVLDFGLARLAQRDGDIPEDTLTTPGMVLGSCPYMAPEQALGQEVTPQSDVFAFGAVLYEAITGERAFKGDTPMRVLQAVVRSTTVPAEDLAPGLPTALYEIIDRCMAREASQRYATAGELGRDLNAVLEIEASSPSTATTEMHKPGVVVASRLRRTRRRRVLAAVAAVALSIGALVGLWFGRHGWEPLRPDPGRWSMTEIFEGAGTLDRPAWGGNGKLLAVGRAQGDKGEVLVLSTDGGDPRVLVEGDTHAVPGHPDFSPDSAAVVVSVLSGSGQSLQVLPAVGGPPVAEIPNGLNGVWLDRTTLVFTRVVDGLSSVWTFDIDSGVERQLVEALDGVSWWEVYPRPGGGFALLGGATDTNMGVFVSDAADGAVEEWLGPGRNVKGVDWTPKGDALVASIGGQIVRLTADGIRPVLPNHQKSLYFPVFSGDGRMAAIHSWQTYDIVSVDPSGGTPECLLCDLPNVGWGSTAPDGAVVFLQRRADDVRIFVRDLDGDRRALTDREEAASCPVVSPDGTRVAYLARVDGTTELRVRPYTGGEPVTLAADLERSEFVSWSPDGGSIAYAGGSPLRVWVVSTAGGTPRSVSGPGGDYPSWSPDGGSIAYVIWTEETDPDQGTWIVTVDGSDPRKVGDDPSRAVWDPRSGNLLQLRRSASDDELELWELAGERSGWSRVSRLDLGVPPPIQMEFRPFTVDPESGRLVMSRLTVTSQLVVFDGLDRDRW